MTKRKSKSETTEFSQKSTDELVAMRDYAQSQLDRPPLFSGMMERILADGLRRTIADIEAELVRRG